MPPPVTEQGHPDSRDAPRRFSSPSLGPVAAPRKPGGPPPILRGSPGAGSWPRRCGAPGTRWVPSYTFHSSGCRGAPLLPPPHPQPRGDARRSRAASWGLSLCACGYRTPRLGAKVRTVQAPRMTPPGTCGATSLGQHLPHRSLFSWRKGPARDSGVARTPSRPTSAKGTAAVTSPPPPGLPLALTWAQRVGRAPRPAWGRWGAGEPLPWEHIARLAGAVPAAASPRPPSFCVCIVSHILIIHEKASQASQA